jgi:hypothetical protein
MGIMGTRMSTMGKNRGVTGRLPYSNLNGCVIQLAIA